MKEVKILEVEKEVLKRIDMICRFVCCILYRSGKRLDNVEQGKNNWKYTF